MNFRRQEQESSHRHCGSSQRWPSMSSAHGSQIQGNGKPQKKSREKILRYRGLKVRTFTFSSEIKRTRIDNTPHSHLFSYFPFYQIFENFIHCMWSHTFRLPNSPDSHSFPTCPHNFVFFYKEDEGGHSLCSHILLDMCPSATEQFPKRGSRPCRGQMTLSKELPKTICISDI